MDLDWNGLWWILDWLGWTELDWYGLGWLEMWLYWDCVWWCSTFHVSRWGGYEKVWGDCTPMVWVWVGMGFSSFILFAGSRATGVDWCRVELLDGTLQAR